MPKHLLLIIVLIAYINCIAQPKIIPQPVSMHTSPGYFSINKQTKVIVYGADSKKVGLFLSSLLAAPTGYKLPVINQKATATTGIVLKLNYTPKPDLGDEGYTFTSTKRNIIITANKPQGLFYGIQTLMQLLPPSIEGHKFVKAKWKVPAVTIIDYPRFGWRGLMLDVSRHFFPKEVIKDYINQLAKYKMNSFHWHLTDDNGWRVEIKGLPQLTDIGAWRAPREGPFLFVSHEDTEPGEKATYGGYYTQDDIREVVKYAQERFVTIVPEVDVPAHSMALIASMPNLSCTGLQYPVDVGTPFYAKKDNVLCVGNDSTYLILDKIFTQIAQLFPGQYIHMGGDEAYKGFWEKCPKCQGLAKREGLKDSHELQSYFVKRVEKILQSKGKKLIGWDEILEGGLAPEATVMSWRGMKGGIAAAKQGHKVVMSPSDYVYLDMYQGNHFIEPHSFYKLWLSDCYSFEPVPDSVDTNLILGGQGNLWSEAVPNGRHAMYMTWPRGMALAEVFWSPRGKRDYDEFVTRVEAHFKRFDAANVKVSRSIYEPLVSVEPEVNGSDTTFKIKISNQIKGLSTYYSFDTTDPDNFYPCYNGFPLSIPRGATQLRVINYRDEKPIGRQINIKLHDLDIRLH
ncbi:beta-N-acetylhexosaminidase [Mucilaginibacter limnophilus]|uniref:beta-N-acetylhexosaminidase n=1 Tax=Mucilaginibacter limnophilus TaxID=1932778 RepID=A0A3S2V341_9SPHI|nr:beta-N-acetylhexosaminidase [Mucilaginibacter limnophilus]RVU02048.1 beta-N-acetylhexosaminidase [Mucilaginibacter limnophilus]